MCESVPRQWRFAVTASRDYIDIRTIKWGVALGTILYSANSRTRHPDNAGRNCLGGLMESENWFGQRA
ncbi:MAG: hypothetical protein WD533_06290 [Dehalococcoidia bacterium]